MTEGAVLCAAALKVSTFAQWLEDSAFKSHIKVLGKLEGATAQLSSDILEC